jgi:tellurium resistance protein TerD
MALTLSLTKDTDSASKLSLDLRKQEPFRVTLSWEGNSDLDLHAFHCVNTGSKATVSSFDDVLSTYNVRRKVRGQDVGHLPKNPDGSFQIHGGALRHSPDATDGDKADIDEYITVDTSLLNPPAQGHIEIPLIAMIHPQSGAKKFKDVHKPEIVITGDDGRELLRVNLSTEFGEFVGVQLGAILVSQTDVQFASIGVGFVQDFNEVLSYFC